MNVIGHDDPGKQAVPLRVECEQGTLRHAGDCWIAEKTRAVPRINPGFQAFASLRVALGIGEKC